MKSIRTITAYCLIAAVLLGSLGCANMTESQQRATSGALIGAVGGAAIAGIAGGNDQLFHAGFLAARWARADRRSGRGLGCRRGRCAATHL